MGSFREIPPGSHPSVGRAPQTVNLLMADSLPAAGLQGNVCPGNRGRNWQAEEDWEQQEGIWGKGEQQMGGSRGSQRQRRLSWEAVEEIFLGEEWSWKELGFKNMNIGMHLFVVLTGQIKLIKYILIFKWRGRLRTVHPQKSWCLLMAGLLWTLPSVPPIGKTPGRNQPSKSKGLSRSVLLQWIHSDKRELIYLKNSHRLMWGVCCNDTIIPVVHKQQSLIPVSLQAANSSNTVHCCLASLSFADVTAGSFLFMWHAQIWANVNDFPRNTSQNIG